jgi:membrane associated rhomboid family serine protease
LSRVRLWNITTWLIAINVAVFVIDALSGFRVTQWGYFSEATAIHHVQLWRFITFQFLHADIGHIFFNMLSLYFFGPIVEGWLGKKRYLAYYLICGIAGALGYLILWRIGLVVTSANSPLVGASAGIFGILIACVKIAPDMGVRLLFPPVLLRMKTLAWIFIGIAVLTIVSHSDNAGGEAAHLGGAFAGWLLISNHEWLNIFDRKRRGKRFWRPGDPPQNFFRQD